MTTETYPPPPTGYRPAYRFTYPLLILNIVGLALLIACVIVLTAWLNQNGIAFSIIALDISEIVILLAALVIVVVIHELLHGLAYRLMGYQVTYGFSLKLGAAYAAAFNQFQKRWHNIVAALTPLIVITAICLPLLTHVPRVGVVFLFGALIMNTAGAVGDMYVTYRLWRLPKGSLLMDISLEQFLIYEPDTTTQ
ncbi:MAG: DUF3267 domain-containing protein [Anaerolineae bacterium]|jgi:hypothetical protein|nr:DUF3267 domain-containing protein [Anaerolineae bacterium]